jgi:hypothetical protein
VTTNVEEKELGNEKTRKKSNLKKTLTWNVKPCSLVVVPEYSFESQKE